MTFFAASEAPPRPESMKFPVFSLLAGNFGIFRDEFAADSPLQGRVTNEPCGGWEIERITGSLAATPGRYAWLIPRLRFQDDDEGSQEYLGLC